MLARRTARLSSPIRSAYDPSMPVDLFQQSLGYMHETMGLSWPMSCVALSAIFRIVSLPLYVSSVIQGKRRADAAKDMVEIRDMAKEAVLLRDQALVDSINKEYMTRMKSHGLTGNPLQGFGYLLMAQAPWNLIMLLSVRGMSLNPDIFSSFYAQSQFAWLPSLAIPDPYGLLPVISAAGIILSTKRLPIGSGEASLSGAHASQTTISARDKKYVEYAIKGACFTFLPFAMQLPSGMFMFFIFNTVFNRIALAAVHRMYTKIRVPKTV